MEKITSSTEVEGGDDRETAWKSCPDDAETRKTLRVPSSVQDPSESISYLRPTGMKSLVDVLLLK